MNKITKALCGIAIVGGSFYGGMKFQQHMDARKPYAIMQTQDTYIFIDKERDAQVPADKVVDSYTKLNHTKKALANLKKSIGSLDKLVE